MNATAARRETLEEAIARVKALPKAAKRVALVGVWQRDDGTWAHAKDCTGRFASRTDAEMDLRFAEEWGR